MIEQALAYPGPALVEVVVHRQELSMPPTISLEQMTVSACSCSRAVLSGAGRRGRRPGEDQSLPLTRREPALTAESRRAKHANPAG